MRASESAREIVHVYESVGELAAVGIGNLDLYLRSRELCEEWHGVGTVDDLRTLVSDGWLSESSAAMDVASDAVELVEQEHDLTSFRPMWDVSGCEVDVGRYLAGEPDNMIDYEITQTARSGRVIVLCASASYSGAVSGDTIKKRGHGIAALAFALSKLGFATELWVDVSSLGPDGKTKGRFRAKVKGPNDALDPALIMFAYSHPAVLRTLFIPAMHEVPERFQEALAVGASYGTPLDPKRDLEEGAIYLPAVRSNDDVPEAKEALLAHLRELGVLDS